MTKLYIGQKVKIASEYGKQHGLPVGLEVEIAHITSAKTFSIVRTKGKAAIVNTSDLETL